MLFNKRVLLEIKKFPGKFKYSEIKQKIIIRETKIYFNLNANENIACQNWRDVVEFRRL